MDSLYDSLDVPCKKEISRRSELKDVYVHFFEDFKSYLVEFVQESKEVLDIKETKIGIKPITLEVDGIGRPLIIQNQGDVECFLSTGMGGFRLNPGQFQKVWHNRPLQVLTISGTTTIGIIST
jgi:hypothetical protein